MKIEDEKGRNDKMDLGVTMRKTTHMKFFIENWTGPQTCLPFGKLIFLCTVLVVIHMGLNFPVLAWEIVTHKELTEEAINIKEGFLNTYLIDNLYLEGGLNEVVVGKTLRWLFQPVAGDLFAAS